MRECSQVSEILSARALSPRSAASLAARARRSRAWALKMPNGIAWSRPATASASRCVSDAAGSLASHELVQRLGDFDAAIVGEHDGVARAAAGARQHRVARGRAGSLLDRRKRGQQFAVRQRLEPHDLAARTDGRQQPPERMRNQQEQRARRRFLEVLQQRVGGVGVHVVGRIDDDDAVAAVMRGQRQEAADPPDLVDRQRGLEGLGLFVERPRQMQHRRVRAARDLPVERARPDPGQESFRRACRPTDAQADSAPAGMPVVALPMPRGPANTSACGSFAARCAAVSCASSASCPNTLQRLGWLGNAVERIVLLRCDAFVHAKSIVPPARRGRRFAPRWPRTRPPRSPSPPVPARSTHR